VGPRSLPLGEAVTTRSRLHDALRRHDDVEQRDSVPTKGRACRLVTQAKAFSMSEVAS
jgi:hypothetical protein